MSDNRINLQEIQARVDKRIQARADFLSSLARYVVINVFLWGIWLVSGLSGGHFSAPWPIFLTLLMGIGVVKQGLATFVGGSLVENMRDREMQRELDKARQYLGVSDMMPEKPKRGLTDSSDDVLATKSKRGAVHLTDDGEMVYDDEPKRSASSGKPS